jgi:glyoxylase-like metal-dependent hydrolase (beta-lactamase superfamily II)
MSALTRREFLFQSGSCASHVILAAAVAPLWAREAWTRRSLGPVVAAEPFARLEDLGGGVWALVSTPLSGDYTTVSNGGIVAGKDGVLAIEGFMQPAGAKWLATQARQLTGKWPTHVLLTHYHSDHVNGVAGYFDEGAAPSLRATGITRDWARDKNKPADPARTTALAGAVMVDPTQESTVDLGGRTVKVIPRAGHTESDVSAIVEDPRIVFAGDLVWNGMFPNYVDAKPTLLGQSVRALKDGRDPTYVPGHGPLARNADIDRYLAMLDEVERAAKAAHQRGVTAAQGAAEYTLPPSLGEWTLFAKSFIATAFGAWYKELDPK